MRSLFALTFAFACSVALVASPAVRAQAPVAAETFLRDRHDAVQQLLRRPTRGDAAVAQRRARLTEALGALLDYAELSRRALGEHDGRATPAQRTEFVSLLRQLVERSYQTNLESPSTYEVRYLGATAAGGAVTVRTVAKSRTNGRAPEVSIDYTLHQVGGEWRVFDIATDGVSLVRNYRAQFHRLVSRDGFDALLAKMRERVANEGDL
jgi:phospholipid transport system substrate-binding protein